VPKNGSAASNGNVTVESTNTSIPVNSASSVNSSSYLTNSLSRSNSKSNESSSSSSSASRENSTENSRENSSTSIQFWHRRTIRDTSFFRFPHRKSKPKQYTAMPIRETDVLAPTFWADLEDRNETRKEEKNSEEEEIDFPKLSRRTKRESDDGGSLSDLGVCIGLIMPAVTE